MDKNEVRIHPTQKPLALMEALVELVTTEEQVVIDPFAGSGTTLVAALKLKRSFIGFENNSDFYEAALRRLSDCSNRNSEAYRLEALL